MSASIIEHADGLPQPQRNWAIVTIALGLVMAVMDGAIANVALPTIARNLDASPAFSIWIVNGYQLAITISLLPLASLGEIIGYRRVYLAGLVLFTLASLFCALSHTLLLLTVARIVQVGLENGDQAEITSGVQNGDQVLVIRKRYAPQQAASNSPLVMGGPKQNNQGGGGSNRSGGGNR